MRLYHGITSVCSIKVRLCLAELGLHYDSEVLDLQAGDQFAPSYLALNPDGVVPTLIDDGLVVVESSLIIEYLDRVHNGGHLMPKDRAGETRARLWLLRCLDVHAAVNTLTFATVGRDMILASKSAEEIESDLLRMPSAVAQMKRRDLIANGLSSSYLDDALVRLRRTLTGMSDDLGRHAWISDPTFGIADIALLPYIDRLDRLGFEGFWRDLPLVAHWLARIQTRPSYLMEVQARLGLAATGRMRTDGLPYWTELKSRLAQL